MHVGGLYLFETPDAAGLDYVAQLHCRLLAGDVTEPLFAKKPEAIVGSFGPLRWIRDEDIDIGYHVRRAALPSPGALSDLFELVGHLHGAALDRHRPLWEIHLIEGLADGRFAVYAKVHHALGDGVAFARRVTEMFSEDPSECGLPPAWSARPHLNHGPSPTAPGAWARLQTAWRDVSGVGPTLAKAADQIFLKQASVLPFAAPRTMLNVQITGARQFAARSWDLDRLKRVAKLNGVTLNDALLAMCSGGLRRYLTARDALPSEPLVANVPVSLRALTVRGEGNAITFVLCNLATDLPRAQDRLAAIRRSMQATKETLAGRTPTQISAYGLVTAVGPALLQQLPGAGRVRPPFNVTISNVPGPRKTLYWNGAKAVGWFPLSVPTNGQALNVTVNTYDGRLEVGLTACRRSVPNLSQLLDDLEEGLAELEANG